MRIILFLLFSLCYSPDIFAQDLNLASWMKPVPPEATFGLKDFMVWCGSAIKGDDGRYYLFYSRWPRVKGHSAWVTDSEIDLAVSDKPTGPFRHLKVVFSKRNKPYWDADVTHNPTIHKFGKKYYLYYTGNYGNGEWWDHRNHQRIGVAIADKPQGPWKRFDTPVIDTTLHSFDHQMIANPSVLQRPDGKFLMIYKGVAEGKMPFGGTVLHGAAIADNPLGPYKKLPNRIFVKDNEAFAAEDPYIWRQNNKYWAIVKDFKGSFTHAGLSLALFQSADGLTWQPAKHPLVSTAKVNFKTGLKSVRKLERPQLLFERGVPIVLYCAVYDGDDNYNIAIPLKKGN